MRASLPALFAALLAALLAAPLSGQTVPRPSLRALHIDSPPVIDGRLDEAVWSGAEVATDFVQSEPRGGEPATQRTEVRVLYDANHIYIGARLFDTHPDSIAAELRRRGDTSGFSDWFRVGIGSYADGRTGYTFAVNPKGVMADAFAYDDNRTDGGWDAVWEAASRVDSLGWTTEIRIPLSQLRYTPPREGEEGYAWQINFRRDLARLQEFSWWAPTPAESGRLVSLFGHLRGLEHLRAVRRFEASPYLVARARSAPGAPGDPFHSPLQPGASLGGDLRAGLGPVLTLTATFNPDFGQVEADPAEVNLTAFETFLPEQRPFFVEGLDLFDFRITPRGAGSEQLLYSRRIGRTPQRQVTAPAGGFVRAPESVRILSAAKVTGKSSSGWAGGILGAVTAAEHAEVAHDDQRWLEPVEPLTGFAAARLTRDFQGGQSRVGAMATMVGRDVDDDRFHFLRRSALVGGLDARHRFGAGRYEANIFVTTSHVEGSENAILRTQRSSARYFQRPDAAHLAIDSAATTLSGWGSMATLSSVGGRNGFWAAVSNRSPGLEVNDAGFQSGADSRWTALLLTRNDARPGRWLRRRGGSFIVVPIWTTAWERTETFAEISGNAELHSFWGGSAAVTRNLGALSVTELRGGPGLLRPARTDLRGGIYSDTRAAVSGALDLSAMVEDESGSWSRGGQLQMRLRASPRLNLSLAPSYRRVSAAAQWLRNVPTSEGETEYLFGRMEQTTAALTSRFAFTATPRLSVQLYAQPFISAAAFSDFRLVDDPRAASFAGRFAAIPSGGLSYDPDARRYRADLDGNGSHDFTFSDPDFRVREVRSTAVMRWEYRPGSALFVVWSHGRAERFPDGHLELWRDTRGLFTAEPTHVLLLKATYWLPL